MFPTSDRNWLEVAELIQAHLKDNDRVVAPIEFKYLINNCFNCLLIEKSANFQWFVMHKGWLDKLDNMLLQRVLNEMNPVHGNSVFITFSNHQDLPAIDRENIHLAALLKQIDIQKVTRQQSGSVDRLEAALTKLDNIDRLIKTEKDIFYDIREIGYLSRSTVELSCRKAFQSSYLGDDTLLCRVLTKYFCYVDATDISVTPHLLLNGYWEIWITQLLSRTIEPGWNCIDIGANCGYYTLLMTDLVGSSGRVLAVEPNQKLASLVDRSIRVNGFKSYAEVSDKAASNRVGEDIQLCVPNGLLGDSTIYDPDKSDLQNLSSQYFPIVTTTVDELVNDWSHVNFIKIDAEGAEWLIWQGMQETLSKKSQVDYNSRIC